MTGWERLTPARFTAPTRSARPVNFKNGRKSDTTQNNDDAAHLSQQGLQERQDAGAIGRVQVADPALFQEHQVAARHPPVRGTCGRRQTPASHVRFPRGIQRREPARPGPRPPAAASANRQVHPPGTHVRVEHANEPAGNPAGAAR